MDFYKYRKMLCVKDELTNLGFFKMPESGVLDYIKVEAYINKEVDFAEGDNLKIKVFSDKHYTNLKEESILYLKDLVQPNYFLGFIYFKFNNNFSVFDGGSYYIQIEPNYNYNESTQVCLAWNLLPTYLTGDSVALQFLLKRRIDKWQKINL